MTLPVCGSILKLCALEGEPCGVRVYEPDIVQQSADDQDARYSAGADEAARVAGDGTRAGVGGQHETDRQDQTDAWARRLMAENRSASRRAAASTRAGKPRR